MTMLRFAGVRRRDLLPAILAGAVTLLSALSLTVLSGWLITRAWEMPPVLDLSVAITAVRALGISRAVFRYLDRLVSHRLALDALATLRARLFATLVRDGHTRTRGDGLVALVSDAERVTDLIVRSLVPRGVAVVLSVVAVLAAGWLHPLAGLTLALAYLVTGLLIPRLAVRAARRARRSEADDEWAVELDRALDHRVEFEAAGLGAARITQAADASRRSSAARVAAEQPLAPAAAAEAWTTGLTVVVLLAVGALSYTGDPTWLGMLLMLPLAAFEAHGPLAAAAIHADEAAAAERRLSPLLSAPAAEDAGASISREPEDLHLRAVDLQCAWGDRTWNLDLAPGARQVIRGPSGCGKTTLLLTLAGLLEPAAGSVTLGGSEDPELRRRVVRVHTEDEWVFATTVRENLRVANPEVTEEVMWEAVEAVGLGPWLESAGGLDLELADGAGSLSSGQRRRLLLARALCSEAPVLLLDEPTAHIAAADAGPLLALLTRGPLPGQRAERTVVVVTHED